MLFLKPEDIKAFLQCKVSEIEHIINQNKNKPAKVIAELIVQNIDCKQVPLQLLQTTKINNHSKNNKVVLTQILKKKGEEKYENSN